MENWRIIWARVLSRAWIPLLIVTGGVFAWQLYRLLPGWIESTVEEAFLENGVIATAFPVEHIGFNQTRIGKGTLLIDRHHIDWDSILVGYKFADLTEGVISEMEINNPVITLRPLLPDQYELEPAPGADVDESVITDVPSGVPPVGVTTEPAGTSPAADSPDPDTGFFHGLPDLPLRHLVARNGVVKFLIRDEVFRELGFRGWMEQQPFGISGEILIGNEELSSHVSLRAPAAVSVVTLQGEAAMPPGALRSLGNEWIAGNREAEYLPRIAASGQLVMDMFAEFSEDGSLVGSAESSIDHLAIRLPGSPVVIRLNEVLAAGVYKEDRFDLEAGAELVLPNLNSLTIQPFGLRISMKGSNRIELDTESIGLGFGAVTGLAALRGQATIDKFPDPGWARLEGSVTGLDFGEIHADPFSILLEGIPEGIRFKGSAIGLHQKGALWIEDLVGEWNLGTQQGSAGFTWYGLVGERLGKVAMVMQQSSEADWALQYNFSGADDQTLIDGNYRQSGDEIDFDLRGELPLSWINALNGWQSETSFDMSGKNPTVELTVGGTFPLYTGGGQLNLEQVDINLPNGTLLEGLTSTIDFMINILPRSSGWQETRIEHLSNGVFSMRDIIIEWELPSFRHLVIRKMTGKIGSGWVEFNPFVVDPLNPSIRTAIQLHGIEADLLRQWVGEKRFSIDGLISGHLDLGWDEGELVLGRGYFKLQNEDQSGQFTFIDESFLRDKFASFAGVPVELRERLLQSLLERGIRIDSLETSLGPAKEQGKLLFRIAISGESKSDLLEVPIEGFVINNLISLEDLGNLLGMVAPLRIDPEQFK